MTYVVTVNNAFNNEVYLVVKRGGRLLSKIRIPADPDLIKSALSTYPDLKYKSANDVPKSIRGLDLERRVDIVA
ncbi:hypothetical protein J4443_04370 [Candidatus Woesearchaeota archaeon]|nr:hypothetical protein [Candidatus Woesearchaeota archaeon]